MSSKRFLSLRSCFIFTREIVLMPYKNQDKEAALSRHEEPIILYVRDDIAIPNIGKKLLQLIIQKILIEI